MLLPGSVHTVTLVERWHWQSSFFPICCIETHLFSCCFFHTWCARISSQKGWTSTHSLVCAYLPKVALSKFSQPWLGGVGQVCWFCSPYQRLSAYFQMHRWERLLLGLLTSCCWISQVPQRHFYGWMPNYLLNIGRAESRDVLHCHDADILKAGCFKLLSEFWMEYLPYIWNLCNCTAHLTFSHIITLI